MSNRGLTIWLLAIVLAMSAVASTSASASGAEGPGIDIVNGTPVPVDSTDWDANVALLTNYNPSSSDPRFEAQFCSGSLVKQQWVLTAAMCIAFGGDGFDRVLIGAKDLKADEGELILVEDVRLWQPGDPGSEFNDLALVKLAQPVTSIEPLELATDLSSPATSEDGWIAGWGLEEPDENAEFPAALRQANVQIFDNPQCSAIYGAASEAEYFCAGHEDDVAPRDACVGDLGAPLVVEGTSGRVLVGVNLYDETCAVDDNFSLYQRVSRFNDWINWAIAPGLSLDPSALAFTPSLYGADTGDFGSIAVTNTGGSDLEVKSLLVEGLGFQRIGGCDPGTILESGASCRLYLRFSPAAPGANTGAVVIGTNLEDRPSVRIPLTGHGVVGSTPTIAWAKKPWVYKTRRGQKLAFLVEVNRMFDFPVPDYLGCAGSLAASFKFRGLRRTFRAQGRMGARVLAANGIGPRKCLAEFNAEIPASAKGRKLSLNVETEPSVTIQSARFSASVKPKWFKPKRRR